MVSGSRDRNDFMYGLSVCYSIRARLSSKLSAGEIEVAELQIVHHPDMQGMTNYLLTSWYS